ncbi:MAG: hypothetical protein JWM16_5665 [Verrucomicrobiales bacterium]|nr:hypothetical protein [Verrucomicrobiales bacterium]
MRSVKAVSFLRFPQSWIGLLLIAVFWPLNWTLPGTPTAYLFFPLWLGYILLIDGLVRWRTGTSFLTRMRWQFGLLFLVSSPGWWLFEWINHRTHNWKYLGSEKFNGLEYFILCTVSFSTVMPAVFESAELMHSFPFVGRFKKQWRVAESAKTRIGFLLSGLVMLGLTLLWPRTCYPFVWISLALVLEAINGTLVHKHSTLLHHLDKGDWRPVLSLALGALLCGVFWEMWNYYSYPKWIYHTPGAQFLHVFEMPLLGYLGYIPFAWEVFGLWVLLTGGKRLYF